MHPRGKIIILDGHSLAHRAFYALPLLTNSKGEYTNAALGFTTMLLKVLEDEKPTHAVVAFDTSAPTFRHERSEAYKANRKPMPDEMRPQMAIIRDLVDTFGIKRLELPGFEADDLIGTVARIAGDKDFEVLIITGDRDALQLVTENVTVLLTKKGISEVDRFTPSAVFEKYGVTPGQIPDLKGLMGDASDNIPGVPGVGEKTAVKLIQEFGSVEGILDSTDRIAAKKVKSNIEANPDLARLSKELATIDANCPVDIGVVDFVFPGLDLASIRPVFEKLEFRSLIRRMDDGKVSGVKAETSQTNSEEGEGSPTLFDANFIEPPSFTLLSGGEGTAALADLHQGEYTLDYLLSGAPTTGKILMLTVGPAEDDGPDTLCIIPGDLGYDSFLAGIRPFFESTDHKKQMHDGKALFTHLWFNGIRARGLAGDTAVAAYLLNSTGKGYTLDDTLFRYCDMRVLEWPTAKALKGCLPEPCGDSAAIGASRCTAIKGLRVKVDEKLSSLGMESLYKEVEMPLVGVLAHVEANGISVDCSKLGELSEVLGGRLSQLEGEIHIAAEGPFNINSPKQLADVLFVRLGLTPKKKTATGFSTDVEVLEELAEEHVLPSLILEYRQVAKLKSTYADSLATLVNPRTKRIHTTFNQMVAATGRLSSTEPNLQNIPIRTEEGRKIRQVFVPENPEWILITGDYSQIELRVLAHFTQDPTLIESFHQGEDIHTRTASEVFGIPLESVTKQMRDAAKAVNFGIVYGQTGFGLSRGLGISRGQAQTYIDNYLGRYPGVKEYMAGTIRFARENGYVETLMGRRRPITDITSRKFTTRQFAERTAINTPIQGSAADIIKAAMVDVAGEMENRGLVSKLLLQVHDELVLEVPPAEKEIVCGILKQKMENVTKLDVPLKVELKVGSNWRDVG